MQLQLDPVPQLHAAIRGRKSAPVFRIKELESVGLNLTLDDLRRHVLVLGGSGSGKTASVVIPALNAFLTYRQQCSSRERPAMLVIDPKRELCDVIVKRAFKERFSAQEVGTHTGSRLDFFARADREQLTAGRVVDELLSLNPEGDYSEARDPFWHQSARRFLVAGVEFHTTLARYSHATPGAARAFWQALATEVPAKCGFSKDDVRALNADTPMPTMLRGLLRLLAEGAREKVENDKKMVLPRAAAMFGLLVRKHLPGIDPSALESLGMAAPETSSCIASTIETMLAPLTDPDVMSRLRFDPLPPADHEGALNMPVMVRSGQLMLLRPDASSIESRIVGRAYKSAFFRAVLEGAALSRGAAYVCDEAHLFVTDDDTGEASFLDRARAFGGMCLLATQSLASLASAVGPQRQQIVSVIVANCATRLQFSTTDASTIRELRDVLPPPPDPHLPHVTAVRPPSLLKTGECYWLRPGYFGVACVRLATDAGATGS